MQLPDVADKPFLYEAIMLSIGGARIGVVVRNLKQAFHLMDDLKRVSVNQSSPDLVFQPRNAVVVNTASKGFVKFIFSESAHAFKGYVFSDIFYYDIPIGMSRKVYQELESRIR